MIIAIVLAAGLSTRFGFNKLLYKVNCKELIRKTIESIAESRVDKTIVVTGYMSEKIVEKLLDLGVEFVYNHKYSEGMSTSVVAGVEYVINKYSKLDAIVFTPGDCSWIKSTTYDQLIDYYYEKIIVKPAILVATYQGQRGHPVLFSSDLINELRKVSEETKGLKNVLNKYWFFTRLIEVNDPGVVVDIDSFNDLNRVKYYVKK